MNGMRSSLAPFAPMMREAQPRDAVQAARDAYIASGGEIVLINTAWLPGWSDQALLHGLFEKATGVKRMDRREQPESEEQGSNDAG